MDHKRLNYNYFQFIPTIIIKFRWKSVEIIKRKLKFFISSDVVIVNQRKKSVSKCNVSSLLSNPSRTSRTKIFFIEMEIVDIALCRLSIPLLMVCWFFWVFSVIPLMRLGDGKAQLLRKYGTQIELLLVFSRIPCSEAFFFLFHRQVSHCNKCLHDSSVWSWWSARRSLLFFFLLFASQWH